LMCNVVSPSSPSYATSKSSVTPRRRHSFPTRRSSDLTIGSIRPWHFIGGALGALYVTTNIVLMPHLGATLTLMTVISVSVAPRRSGEHTSELQSRFDLVCRLLLEKKKKDYEYDHRGLW